MPIPVNIGVTSPLFGAEGRPIVEPGALLVTGNDNLRINSWNSVVGVALTIRLRFIDATTGDIVANEFVHTPNSNRTKATSDFPLSVGFPLNITVFASAGVPLIGQTFVQVQLVRGFTGATLLLATLLQGYVTSVQAIAYPGSPIIGSLEGAGVLRSVVGTTPGAGADITETVPTGARWEVLTMSATFTASVAVANRFPLYQMDDGVQTFYRFGLLAALTASQVRAIVWHQGGLGAVVDQNNSISVPLPVGIRMAAGFRMRTTTTNIDVADQWSLVRYVVREWIEAAS